MSLDGFIESILLFPLMYAIQVHGEHVGNPAVHPLPLVRGPSMVWEKVLPSRPMMPKLQRFRIGALVVGGIRILQWPRQCWLGQLERCERKHLHQQFDFHSINIAAMPFGLKGHLSSPMVLGPVTD